MGNTLARKRDRGSRSKYRATCNTIAHEASTHPVRCSGASIVHQSYAIEAFLSTLHQPSSSYLLALEVGAVLTKLSVRPQQPTILAIWVGASSQRENVQKYQFSTIIGFICEFNLMFY